MGALEFALVATLALGVWRRLETGRGRALLGVGLALYGVELVWWGWLAF